MGRCGCADKCGCYFAPGNEGIKITGSGSLDDPFVISVSSGSWAPGACQSADVCIPGYVKPGMSGLAVTGTNPPKIGTLISQDPTNTLTISPGDRGLFQPPATSPVPSPACTVTIAGLPASRASGGPGLVIGRSGFGENVSPWNMLKSVRAAVDARLDAVQIDVSGLADGTSVLAPYFYFGTVNDGSDPANLGIYTDPALPGLGTTGPVRIPGIGQNWAARPGTNSDLTRFRYDQITISQWKSLNVAKDGATFNPADWPGWFGGAEWFQLGADTTDELLNEVAGKLVIFYRLPRNVNLNSATPATFTGTPHPTFAAAAVALRNTLLRHCVSQSAIVLANGQYQDVNTPTLNGQLANSTDFKGSGFERGVWLEFNNDVKNNPPAQLVSAGIKWVFVDVNLAVGGVTPGSYGQVADAYVKAGLNVVYIGLNRRANKPTETTWKVRGVCSTDPLYYAQREAPRQKDLWPISVGGNGGSVLHMSGQLHDGPNGGYTGHMYRPYQVVRGQGSRTGGGFDGGWQLPFTGRNSTTASSTTILGWACPLPDPRNWMMTWEMKFDQFSNNQSGMHGGIMFSLVDDSQVRDTASVPLPSQYSLALVRQNGELFLSSVVNGTIVAMDTSQGQPLTLHEWQKYKLVVSASEIRFYLYDRTIPGPTPIYRQMTTISNSAHRNPYIALNMNGQASLAASPIVSFRKVRINLGDGDPWLS